MLALPISFFSFLFLIVQAMLATQREQLEEELEMLSSGMTAEAASTEICNYIYYAGSDPLSAEGARKNDFRAPARR
jgi:hypothetical protein